MLKIITTAFLSFSITSANCEAKFVNNLNEISAYSTYVPRVNIQYGEYETNW